MRRPVPPGRRRDSGEVDEILSIQERGGTIDAPMRDVKRYPGNSRRGRRGTARSSAVGRLQPASLSCRAVTIGLSRIEAWGKMPNPKRIFTLIPLFLEIASNKKQLQPRTFLEGSKSRPISLLTD